MKTPSIPALTLLFALSLFILAPNRVGHGASDPPRKGAEKKEEQAKPSKRAKGEARRESQAQLELREALDKARAELEKARDSLHEAHKELGAKAETISTLEAKLSSVTAQLEKARDDLKKTGSAADTIAKQVRQLEAGRKKVAELQDEIKGVEKKAAMAIASAKESPRAKEPSKAVPPREEASKTVPSNSKAPVIAPIYYDHASAVNYPERDRVLMEVTDALKKLPKARISITGHADDSKYTQTNEDVSMNRAKFLAAHLMIHGVPEDRITVNGLGNAKPVKGQANRSVEISILP